MDPAHLQTLHENDWFATMPRALREAIVAAGSVRRYANGAALYRRGEAADGWFGVLEGAVKVAAVLADGREIVMTYMEPGNWLGEISLFDDGPRAHDGVAQGETTVLFVPRAAFDAICESHPALLKQIIRLQSSRLRLLFAAIEDMNAQPLQVRLAKQLLSLARAYGVTSNEGITIQLRLPQEGLAQLLGTSRQRINQELKAMADAGWVHARYGKLVVHDVEALRTLVTA
jgi:CRP-like cAMP-binding protein